MHNVISTVQQSRAARRKISDRDVYFSPFHTCVVRCSPSLSLSLVDGWPTVRNQFKCLTHVHTHMFTARKRIKMCAHALRASCGIAKAVNTADVDLNSRTVRERATTTTTTMRSAQDAHDRVYANELTTRRIRRLWFRSSGDLKVHLVRSVWWGDDDEDVRCSYDVPCVVASEASSARLLSALRGRNLFTPPNLRRDRL